MNNTVLKVKLGEILYWLFFASIFFAKGIGWYDGQPEFKLILIFALICLTLKLCVEKYTAAEYVKIVLVVVITGVTYLTSGEKGLLLFGLMLIGMKYVDVKRLFSIALAVWSLAFALLTGLSLLRMDETVFKVHSKLGLGHIFRWSLGYPHPNVLQVSYVILAMLVVYVLGERFRLKHGLWLLLGNCVVFMYSVSYTGFIMFMILLAGRIYLMFRKKLCVVEKGVICLIYPICILLSLLAPVKVTGEWFNLLNKLLSTRMELGWWYLKPENYSWFGIRISDIVTESLTMDNAYLFGFIAYGIIPFTLLSVGIMYTIVHCVRKNQYMEVLVITAVTIGGLTEPFLFNTSFKNLVFIFMGALLFENDKEQKKEFAIRADWNREVKLSMNWWKKLGGLWRKISVFHISKLCGGMLGAILLCVFVQCFTVYPAGYIVRRSDCADVTKEVHYYDESDQEYADYKKMAVFEPGEEVEYFSGNIVRMEQIRDIMISIILGYAMGYLGTGTFEFLLLGGKQEGKINGRC